MKQEIEQIIKNNLPEKKGKYSQYNESATFGFNQALSQINTSLIADEVLKVVVEKIIEALTSDISHSVFEEGWLEKWQVLPTRGVDPCIECDNGNKIRNLLSNLSPNKENK